MSSLELTLLIGVAILFMATLLLLGWALMLRSERDALRDHMHTAGGRAPKAPRIKPQSPLAAPESPEQDAGPRRERKTEARRITLSDL